MGYNPTEATSDKAHGIQLYGGVASLPGIVSSKKGSVEATHHRADNSFDLASNCRAVALSPETRHRRPFSKEKPSYEMFRYI